MRLTAECVLTHDRDGRWNAYFPQYGSATSGKTRDEALRAAQEALELEAVDLMDEGSSAPKCAHLAEVAVLTVDVSPEEAERDHYITKAQAAERLVVSRPRVSALVSAGVLETKSFDGRELVSVESVSRYAASPRQAGRPEREAIAV